MQGATLENGEGFSRSYLEEGAAGLTPTPPGAGSA